MEETISKKEQEAQIVSEVRHKLYKLENENKLNPVMAIHSTGQKQFMEHIKGTTKYLASNKKNIYDVSFLELYNHDLKIPEGCLAINNFLLKIEKWAHIDHPDSFNAILLCEAPKTKGTRFYLDNELFMDNIPFIKSDRIRDELLAQRNEGTRWFKVLKIIDPAGNETLFYPSKRANRIHFEQELFKAMDEAYQKNEEFDKRKKNYQNK